MSPKYDLFEKFPDGSSLWRACVVGLEGVRRHMLDLAQSSSNQFYAIHVASGKIISPKLRLGALSAPLEVEKPDRTKAVAA